MDVFKQGLKGIAQKNEITKQVSVLHGEKYIIDGILETPIGKGINVRTVWIIEKGEINPRFVTAHPA